MDALIGFLGTVRDITWVYLGAMFLVATGLFIFDRRRDEAAGKTAAEDTEVWSERRAA